MRTPRVAEVPRIGDYLTDGTRLVQVIAHHDGNVVCENARWPADSPAPVVRIKPAELEKWRMVAPRNAL